MTDYTDILQKIVDIEKDNFGPVALKHARKVEGIEVDEDGNVEVSGENQEQVLLDLVQEYHHLVGEAVSAALKQEDISDPEMLENLSKYFSRHQETKTSE
jgi:hypothetical protein